MRSVLWRNKLCVSVSVLTWRWRPHGVCSYSCECWCKWQMTVDRGWPWRRWMSWSGVWNSWKLFRLIALLATWQPARFVLSPVTSSSNNNNHHHTPFWLLLRAHASSRIASYTAFTKSVMMFTARMSTGIPPVLHCFGDTAFQRWKIAIFCYPSCV